MVKKIASSQTYHNLDEITEQFESGKFSLEDGLKKFEEGLALSAECKEYLKQVENKIIEIKKKFNINEQS